MTKQKAPSGNQGKNSPLYKMGYQDGLNQVRHAVLTHLQYKYIHDIDRPARGSAEANYLLGLATELSSLLKGLE